MYNLGMNKKLYIVVFVLALIGVVSFVLEYTSYRGGEKVVTQEAAINSVIELYPELAIYKTTSLPPSSIEAKETSEGWYVAFIQSGSGLPGILNAKCYQVYNSKSVILVGAYIRQGDEIAQDIVLETCKPIFDQSTTPSILPYGDATLQLHQLANFKDLSIRLLSIEEDSRCPSDVQCIQAGTVRVKAEVVSGMGTSTSIFKLGQVFTTEAEVITLKGVTPEKNSKVAITDKDYRFVFNVMLRKFSENSNPQDKCFIGGCSGQLCTDRSNVVSTCEYKNEYACYKSAVCQRQSNGECGWTQTAALASCLINSRR